VSSAYCRAAPAHPAHARYHDLEYGFPSSDDCVLFERLMLEINQAGLSWLMILNKRADFRAAFAGFDIDRVAAFGADDVERLLADAGIVRTRLKIAAAIEDARRIQVLRQSHGSFSCWLVCASPASARCLDAIVPQKLPFHRWPDRQRILDEPRLSGGGARARLPGLCADRGTLAALGPPGTGLNVP
jgi:DNA-3-methyladenine glycosylase I